MARICFFCQKKMGLFDRRNRDGRDFCSDSCVESFRSLYKEFEETIKGIGAAQVAVDASPHDPCQYVKLGTELLHMRGLCFQVPEHWLGALFGQQGVLNIGEVPSSSEAPFCLAVAHLLMDRERSAYLRGLALRPGAVLRSSLYFGLSYIQRAKDKYPDTPSPQEFYFLEEAARQYELHLRQEPDDSEASDTLPEILERLGRSREAARLRARQEEAAARRELGLDMPLIADAHRRESHNVGIAFEQKCMTLLERMSLDVEVTAVTGDGGIDIVATSNQPLFSGTYIVQCKDWKKPVGEPPIRDLCGVVASEHATKGILITSSNFTEAAKGFARGKNNLELIDGALLESLIEDNSFG